MYYATRYATRTTNMLFVWQRGNLTAYVNGVKQCPSLTQEKQAVSANGAEQRLRRSRAAAAANVHAPNAKSTAQKMAPANIARSSRLVRGRGSRTLYRQAY